ncbi:hypothetical protein AK812_SmicGene23441 [Symbiodinium microadriaticum]|uniref:Uncharacterized protein n=1 Tax=Symbiodinium microadriaticum TaxID=2951 RepID=A0A1Q9DH75_SYMMI|nr:hypothetical protein AK812_SmicGene23441 [Symbiodinium microadriaticum]
MVVDKLGWPRDSEACEARPLEVGVPTAEEELDSYLPTFLCLVTEQGELECIYAISTLPMDGKDDDDWCFARGLQPRGSRAIGTKAWLGILPSGGRPLLTIRKMEELRLEQSDGRLGDEHLELGRHVETRFRQQREILERRMTTELAILEGNRDAVLYEEEDHGADLGMSPNDTIFVDEYVRRCRELETLVYDKVAGLESTALLAKENLTCINKAWLAKNWDVFEALPSPDDDLTVRLRPLAEGSERQLEQQIEAVRSECEELQRLKQRAIAEEQYLKAAEIKRRFEAASAELSSLLTLCEDESVADDALAEGRIAAARQQIKAFEQDVNDEALFPSLAAAPKPRAVPETDDPLPAEGLEVKPPSLELTCTEGCYD